MTISKQITVFAALLSALLVFSDVSVAEASLPQLDPCPSPYEVTGKYQIDETTVPPGVRISGNGSQSILIANSSETPLILETSIGKFKLANENVEGRGNFAKFKWNDVSQMWVPQDENSIGGYTAVPMNYINGVPSPTYPESLGTKTVPFVIKAQYGEKIVTMQGSWTTVGKNRVCTAQQQAEHDRITTVHATTAHASWWSRITGWFFNIFR
jgi:hypothetical protein